MHVGGWLKDRVQAISATFFHPLWPLSLHTAKLSFLTLKIGRQSSWWWHSFLPPSPCLPLSPSLRDWILKLPHLPYYLLWEGHWPSHFRKAFPSRGREAHTGNFCSLWKCHLQYGICESKVNIFSPFSVYFFTFILCIYYYGIVHQFMLRTNGIFALL